MQIVTTLSLPKYTSRISDLRAAGEDIEGVRGKDGIWRYYVRDKATQLGMSL